MYIQFDRIGKNPNIDKATTAYSGAVKESAKTDSAVNVDISGTVMDNNAYTGHGKTAEDVMQEAGSQDLTWQRNYMTVMSNSMSDEDFARLQEEGFHPGSTKIETVVTIVDKIKAAMAQSGEKIIGYTDTLDRDILVEITGSEGLAQEIIKQFRACDVPVTKENTEAVMAALEEAAGLSAPEDGAVKYLVENGLEPTVDNLYLAEHCGAADAGRQARGYYNAGAGGYLAKKADAFDWQQLTPQIKKVIEEAGLENEEAQAMEEAKWLLEKGTELTPENLRRLHKIQETPLPLTDEQFIEAAAIALAEGKKAGAAVPGTTETVTQAAARMIEKVNRLTDEAVDLTAAEGKRLNLKNLFAAQQRIEQGEVKGEKAAANLRARRQLEEVRLQMTVEANRLLLKSGFSIDTAAMEELIEALKQAEQSYNSALFEESDKAKAQDMRALYGQTMDTVSYLYHSPAAVIGQIAYDYGSQTLSGIEQEAKSLQKAYEKAGSSYEMLMTAPRADMGDSIRKAFANVDELLKQQNLQVTQDNRRAVRILGYNRMEISPENIELVKAADTSLQRILKKMTPAAVLDMIRDGENPLAVSMEELSDYLDEHSGSDEQEAEKYSKFLYKLEKDGEISKEEKDSFIGIYRMLRTLEKNDGAAVGALVNQGAELTFQNLLSAVRSRKKGQMDYKVDDSFGGVESVRGERDSISAQIQTGYTYAQNLVHEMYSNLTPELLKEADITPDKTLENAAEALREAAARQVVPTEGAAGQMAGGEQMQTADGFPEQKSEQQWIREQADLCRKAARVQEDVVEALLEYGQPITADNLTAAQAYFHERGSAWRTIYDKGVKNSRMEALEEKRDKLIESFDSAKEAKEAYEELAGEAAGVLTQEMENADSYMDVRQMSLLHRQLSLCSSMAREEVYEIPVSIDGEMTSINLKIRSAEGTEGGRVVVTCRTEQFGNTAAEFTVRSEEPAGRNTSKEKALGEESVTEPGNMQVTGYVVCENPAAQEYFTGLSAKITELFSQNGLQGEKIQVLSGSSVALAKFSQTGAVSRNGETKAVQQDIDPKKLRGTENRTLYKAARLFLTALRQAER